MAYWRTLSGAVVSLPGIGDSVPRLGPSRSVMASNAKKTAERQGFDLGYGDRTNLDVSPSERPDFIVEHRNGDRFGVEVTEFFDTESRARLERIEGYAGDLLAGKNFKHKDDRRLLKVTKVDYTANDGRSRIT